MNSLTVPPSPNWYESNILACAPDNTLIFGARTDIVILENSGNNVPANVRIISRAHTQKVICVNVNKNWGQTRKLVVSLSDDKIVKVWDAEAGKKMYCHNQHLPHTKVIGATFAGEERVISVSEDGTIIIWNLALNETNSIKDLFGMKVSVTCLSTCPHATWLTAFGLKNGLVIVADLRRNGKVLYKLRGHDKSVISLTWCPAPINIFPKNPLNFVGQRKEEIQCSEPKSENDMDIQVCQSLLKMYGYNEDDEKYLQTYLLKEYEFLEHKIFDTAFINQQDYIVTSNNITKSDEVIKDKINGNENIEDKNISQDDQICQANLDEFNNSKTYSDVGRDIVTKPTVEEEPRKEFLLASSANEGNIYIWRAGTDGRLQTFLSVPNKPANRKFKSSADKSWITLCWVSPTILLSSSRSSELLAWTLPKPQNNSKLFTVIHKDHNSQLFSIAAPMKLKNEFNWKEHSELNAWTTSQDRLLLNTSINSERTNLACYPTFGGSVQTLQLSPLDPNRLAIGTADGFIKFWDLSRPHSKNIIMASFYQKIQSKVSAMAWHPTNELLLAYGTSEGRVGYLDTNNRSKMPVLLPQYFKSQVYKLEWGPINGNKERLGLYVVGEGSLVLFDIKDTSKGSIEIDKPDNTFIYSLAWKPDYSVLLLTTKSGFLIVYSPDLKIICKHYFQYRINDIVWHPNAATTGTKESNWFATISNAKTIVVYEFNAESGNNDENIINTYQGASEIINSIAWSPYDPSLLVMACEFGIAQVWNVRTNEILSTFVNPNFEGVLSVVWSPIDPDYIISGSKDNTLRIWKISEHKSLDVKELSSKRKKVLKEISAEAVDLLPKTELPDEQTVKVKKPIKNSLLPSYYNPKSPTQIVSDLKKLLLWQGNPSATEVTIGEDCEVDILNIFGTDEAMINLVSLNELVHRQKGKYNLNTMLSLFRGDISVSIKEAIEEKRVNPMIISLAPMVSPKLWQAACETYANQLSEESNSDPLEVATYYLACHKVKKAVESLCDALLFREALALAKCRRLEEMVNTIIEKWAVYAMQTGNFEVAAQCDVYLKKYEEAASVLFRRSDLELLEFAVDLAKLSGNTELHKAVLFRYNAFRDNSIDKADVELPTKPEVLLIQNGLNDKELIFDKNPEVLEKKIEAELNIDGSNLIHISTEE